LAFVGWSLRRYCLMVLDPQVKALLAKLAEQGLPSTDEMSLPQAREAVFIFEELEGEPQPVAQVRDLTVPGPAGELPVRLSVTHIRGGQRED
jgi:acetyl esterase